MDYRKDIDGLRALAVVPVIFFHAGFDFLSGGYLGVDIFFVISGFLITSILLQELKVKKFSIVLFYERRARRILPALFFVLTITSLLSFIFMPPYELKEYSQSLLSVVLFFSNLFFLMEIDYFSLLAEEMPLLHTWSLAIEEQFYFIFPPMLFLAYRLGLKFVLCSTICLTIFSFLLMLYVIEQHSVQLAFYSPFTRAWELLLGSTTAILITKKLPYYRLLPNIGLFLLVFSIVFWPEHMSHPSYLLVIPVLSTCLIILFPVKTSLSYKLLSNKKFVYVGLISYSLYLWHQPILALLRLKTVSQPSAFDFILAIVITFSLAALSYHFIETPFRNKKRISRAFIFKMSLIGIILFSSLGLFGHTSQGLPERFSNLTSYKSSMAYSPKRGECHSSDNNYIAPQDACIYVDTTRVNWAIFGDSHVVEPGFALAERLNKNGDGLQHHSYSGCPPIFSITMVDKELCSEWIEETLYYIENQKTISDVLLGFRYSASIFGDNIDYFPEVPIKVNISFLAGTVLSDDEKLRIYWHDLHEIISRLTRSGKTVWLMHPIPELPTHISKVTSPFSIFGDQTLLDLKKTTSMAYYFERHKFILSKLDSLKKSNRVKPIKIYELLCDTEGCPAILDGKALYFDDDHLSLEGSRILLERLSKQESSFPQ